VSIIQWNPIANFVISRFESKSNIRKFQHPGVDIITLKRYLQLRIQEFLIGMGVQQKADGCLQTANGGPGAKSLEADEFLYVKGDF
jgi:hypothetical protein